MFASRSTGGFYDPAIHASMPEDVVEITKERHAELLAGQGAGKVIDWDDQGQPFLSAPPERFAFVERTWRNMEVERIAWLRERHRDELELSLLTSLSADQYIELLAYLQLLRGWPQSDKFPDQDYRPLTPGWIAGQTGT